MSFLVIYSLFSYNTYIQSNEPILLITTMDNGFVETCQLWTASGGVDEDECIRLSS